MPVLAHALHTLHPDAHHGEDGPLVAGAIGLQAGERLHLLQRHTGGIPDHHVQGQGGYRLLTIAERAHAAVHPPPESGDVLLPDIEARRQLMTAKIHQQVLAGLQSGEEIESAVAPAGALANPVLQMDHKAGAGIFLAEAAGHNAHHTLMP